MNKMLQMTYTKQCSNQQEIQCKSAEFIPTNAAFTTIEHQLSKIYEKMQEKTQKSMQITAKLSNKKMFCSLWT